MGKKILVLSDNHGNLTNLKYILEAFQGEYDVLVHCGDSEFEREMVAALTDRPVYLAEGNCDYDFSGDGEEIFELAEHICFVTHGHRYGVNWGEEELLERAQDMGADIVFYALSGLSVLRRRKYMDFQSGKHRPAKADSQRAYISYCGIKRRRQSNPEVLFHIKYRWHEK